MNKEFQGYYISNSGQVFTKKGQEMKQKVNEQGYCIIRLGKKNHRVHRLVAHTFIGPCRSGYQVNHIDGNKLNNHLNNLEYISKSKNQLHRRHTLCKHGSTRALLISAQKDSEIIMFSSINSAHKCLRISYTCIKQCCEGIRKTAGGYTFSYHTGNTQSQ